MTSEEVIEREVCKPRNAESDPSASLSEKPSTTTLDTGGQERDKQLIDLIARCAIKDQQALKLLYERLSSYLNGVAFRIVQNTETSNEVLQEAFIQIWENAGSYRSYQSSPLTWLTSIVRYRALDRLAFDQRRDDISVDLVDSACAQNIASQLRTPEQYAQQCQLSQSINECLSQLKEPMRLSIELAYLYGYSREEIASKFESKVNTIKSWLFRGAKLLKECLGEQVTNE